MTDDLQARLHAELQGSYAIQREIGGGGMSHVFLATETGLGRRVVIKVLSPQLAAGINADRFRREIQLVARMQHSCIVPVLSSGVAAGLPYYTMPYVEGESLRARLTREGELPIAEVTRILRDILEALSYAHEHGIVHRDIKPENVLLTRHHALLTDFGVAKAASIAGQDSATASLTGIGLALGTPAYMAPEQAAADPATDHRADLYAVGAMAYEMLTGHQVFSARSPQATLAAHAIEPVEPVEQRRPSTPPQLAALVMQALEKRPADRPASAEEMLRELDAAAALRNGTAARATTAVWPRPRQPRRRRMYLWIGGTTIALAALALLSWSRRPSPGNPPTAAPLATSVAVLPFVNIGGSQQDEYLSDGLSEELIAALSRIPALQVAGRTSSFAFKGRYESARAIGEALGVSHILSGSVRRAGEQLRVSAQLTNAQSGYNVWSDTYNLRITDVLAMQEDISAAIAEALEVRLGASRSPSTTAASVDPQAYEHYLRGRYLLNQRGPAIPLAIRQFQVAIDRDRTFAPAHGALAEAHWIAPSWRYALPAEAFRDADIAAQRALALDPRQVDALMVLGLLSCEANDFGTAERHFSEALKQNPGSARLLYSHALCLIRAGRLRQALAEAQRAIDLDPLNPQLRIASATAYTYGGKPRDALATARAGLGMAPNLGSLAVASIWAGVALRDTAVIREELARAVMQDSNVALRPSTVAAEAIIATLSGEHSRAVALVQPYLPRPDPVQCVWVAAVFSLAGRAREAVRLLNLAYENHGDQLSRVNHPVFDWLRSTPEYSDFAQRHRIPTVERLE